ncbi:MAG TPA: hypothetical protein VIP98_20405 [Microlunatus sp.]
MATLTLTSTTRSTVIIPSRPRQLMSLSHARDMIMLADGRYAVSARPVEGSALHQDLQQQITDHKSITTIDAAVKLASHKSCGAVIDQGAQGMSRNAKGAFVTRLGSRPPSPPV